MEPIRSYACGEWKEGRGEGTILHHAVTGEPVARAGSEGIDFAAMLAHAREKGGPALRAMTFHQRAALLKDVAAALSPQLAEFYEIAHTYGATKFDAWMDIEGGLATLGVYAKKGRSELPDARILKDGDVEPLSRGGNFAGRHIYVSLEGVAVQINAFNFPCWGMLEKLAPALLAGLPSIVKPATSTALLTHRVVQVLVGSGLIPEGALQFISGSVGDLLDHLTCQDVVAFTGGAGTGAKLKSHPTIVKQAVRFNMEADSLNCVILGLDAASNEDLFNAFCKEVVQEMTVKAGQKCTAIRRILLPAELEDPVISALSERLAKVVVGDPKAEGVTMGPLASRDQVKAARLGMKWLEEEVVYAFGDPDSFHVVGADRNKGAFFAPLLLRCINPHKARFCHEVEIFGPVATIMAYKSTDDAIDLARKGGGSLCASLYSEDDETARTLALGLAPYHGRLLLMNAKAAPESTGHGTAMPQLVHGGPGRAGGGEELGGIRAVKHYMQRVALQGAPDRLEQIAG